MGHLLWFSLWIGITFVGALLTPSPDGHGTHTRLGLAPCPSVIAFNRPCPGCGLTTSFTATIHGELALAFRAHPFGSLFYGLLTVSAIACLYGFTTKQRLNTESRSFNLWLAVVVGVFLVYGGIRFAVNSNFDKGFGAINSAITGDVR